jgi:hypothetical protein
MNRAIVFILGALLIGYGLFEARRLLEGPVITITSPLNGSATSTTVLTITGVAQNIAFLTIDDRRAFTDESGHFSLTFSPPPGYTSITVAATDRFGRRAQKSIAVEVLDYCPV